MLSDMSKGIISESLPDNPEGELTGFGNSHHYSFEIECKQEVLYLLLAFNYTNISDETKKTCEKILDKYRMYRKKDPKDPTGNFRRACSFKAKIKKRYTEKDILKPKSGTQRKYAANIGENSKRQITLIDAPEDYEKSELLSLTDELSLLYVKKFPTEKEYDITDVSFVATDHISDINSEEYNRLELNPQDHINLQSFINDYNTLIDNVNKYSECNNIDELNLLENTKLHFFNVWLQNRVSFENQEVDNLFKDILKRIKASNKINISKIKHYIGKPITIPTLDTLPASCQISSTRKMPTIHMCLYNKNVNDNPPKAPQEETDTIAPSDNNCTSK